MKLIKEKYNPLKHDFPEKIQFKVYYIEDEKMIEAIAHRNSRKSVTVDGNIMYYENIAHWSYLEKEEYENIPYYEYLTIKDDHEYNDLTDLKNKIINVFKYSTYFYFDKNISFSGMTLEKALLTYEIFTLLEQKSFHIEITKGILSTGFTFTNMYELIGEDGELLMKFSSLEATMNYLFVLYRMRPLTHEDLFNFSDEECFSYLKHRLNGKCIITYGNAEEIDI